MSESQRSKRTILVVEDELLVRLDIIDFLETAHYVVIAAATGEAAVALLQTRNEIDLVFTDIRLGGELTGWDVGEASRATHPNIPVIYTSGAVVVPERPVAGSVFLKKPYDPAFVLATCESLHESHGSKSG